MSDPDDPTPSTAERDRVMGHAAENDGIEEYDNPLPDWWLGMFFFCILWAVGYAVDYHWLSDRSQAASYVAEMAAAEARWPAPAALAAADVSPAAIEAGRLIFQQNCVGCHGASLQGGIGPNLVDDTWIHGGTLPEIQATITDGVPDKGMLTWGPILGPEKIAQVAAFVHDSGPKDGR
jgi:cytochrome c oxidase cbb3-type subunit 3